MIRLGFLGNPKSERNRRNGTPAFHAAIRSRRFEICTQLKDFRDLPAILAEFRARNIDLIVIDGGDGTVHGVLTEMMNNPGNAGRQPRLAVLASGMTNAIAADVGVRGANDAGLQRLLSAIEDGDARRLARRTIRLALGDAASGRSPVGMFFGAAALYRGAKLARDRIHARGVRHGAGVALTMAAIASRSLFSRADDEFLSGDHMELSVDGGPSERRPRFLLMATTLRRLALGMNPFWGQGNGAIRYLEVPAPPPRLLTALAMTLTRRPRPWMIEAGYRSGRAERMSLTIDTPCVLDGEIVQAPPGEAITLSVGDGVEFVRA